MSTVDFSSITNLIISLVPVIFVIIVLKWIIDIFGDIGM